MRCSYHGMSACDTAEPAPCAALQSHARVSCLQRADQALADFFTSIGNSIAGLAQVITGQKQAQVSIAPPAFFANGAANVSTSLAGIAGTVSNSQHSPRTDKAAYQSTHLMYFSD